MKMYQRYYKRILDVIFSLIGIIIAFPLFIIVSILIRVKLGRPILFKQKRVSKDGKVFCMVKFRTMSEKKDELGVLLPNEKRLTKLGQILRSSSLDELPELINILKGDISFVGPRPLIPDYMPYYTEVELKRFHVKGGLIPPEILYNNVTPTWEEQFGYEIDYANNVTFLLDLKILLATTKGMFIRNSIEYGSYERPPFIVERMRQVEEESLDIEEKNHKEIEKNIHVEGMEVIDDLDIIDDMQVIDDMVVKDQMEVKDNIEVIDDIEVIDNMDSKEERIIEITIVSEKDMDNKKAIRIES